MVVEGEDRGLTPATTYQNLGRTLPGLPTQEQEKTWKPKLDQAPGVSTEATPWMFSRGNHLDLVISGASVGGSVRYCSISQLDAPW